MAELLKEDYFKTCIKQSPGFPGGEVYFRVQNTFGNCNFVFNIFPGARIFSERFLLRPILISTNDSSRGGVGRYFVLNFNARLSYICPKIANIPVDWRGVNVPDWVLYASHLDQCFFESV